MGKVQGRPFRAIFSGDMKEFLQGIDLDKVPLEFVVKVVVNLSSGNSFAFDPRHLDYVSDDDFLEKLNIKLDKMKDEINFVDFYVDSSKLKESVKEQTKQLFQKLKYDE